MVRGATMTQSNEQLNQTVEYVLNELQCPICLELYECPIILPCSHILCRTPCAARLFNHGFLRCPVCRDNSLVIGGIDSLPHVLAIENIINRYKNEVSSAVSEDDVCQAQDVPCQLCRTAPPRKAARSCLDCSASYCKQCLQLSHPAKEPFTGHKLIEPEKYTKPPELLKCTMHNEEVTIYCQACKAVCCVLCEDCDLHKGHTMVSVSDAFTYVKEHMVESLSYLESSQENINEAVKVQNEQIQNLKKVAEYRQDLINEQCDSLIAEIEAKRSLFLSDLEYESQGYLSSMDEILGGYRKQSTVTEGLIYYSREVLKESDERSFLQVADSVIEKLSKNTVKKENLLQNTVHSEGFLQQKVVDFRKEKALLRDLTYLIVPETPMIDVLKCSRSSTSVVIVLCPPSKRDVIGGYHVYFCSQEEKDKGEQQMMTFETPHEERTFGRPASNESSVCLIHDNLQCGTVYYFCVKAYNLAGSSETSNIVNCKTLTSADSTIPVPEITETSCKTFTSSIQICSPSPVDSAQDQNISHFLLYREVSNHKIWKSMPLYGLLNHRVFGLEPDTLYCFVVMACNKDGECQISAEVNMRTEMAAY